MLDHFYYQISGQSIAVDPDQELKDLLIDHDILSLYEILKNNSINTKIIWDLEEQQLREMGMNVGDMLIYKKAKDFRKGKFHSLLYSQYKLSK